MKAVNVKVYTLTEAELVKLFHIGFKLCDALAPDNMRTLVQAAVAKLKKDSEG